MDVPPPSLLRLPLPIGISLVPCLLHRLGLCNQAIDLLTAEDLPQEAEVFDFCPEHFIFFGQALIESGEMLILPIQPTVGGVQPVIAVQRLVIATEHLPDDFFQPPNQRVHKPLLVGFGGHQGRWRGELKFFCYQPLL